MKKQSKNQCTNCEDLILELDETCPECGRDQHSD
jgi:RNA polymerase subunit RPABC4/transcription elongation factor Spt4